MRRTKIIATIGPASSDAAVLDALIAAGVDVFRLNFSHGTRDTHGNVIARIRERASRQKRHVALLQDLSGPKIRTGKLRDGAPLTLRKGDPLEIVVGTTDGHPGRVSTTYAELPAALRTGDTLLLDDGRIELQVTAAARGSVQTVVIDGGELSENKGITAPGVTFPTAGPTPKDLEDLDFGVSAGVDFIALSFVQSAEDIRIARERLAHSAAPATPLIAKLERPQAVERIDEILHEADAVMVARGDLGLELPLERVPRVQKEVTRRARALGMPVILATQVLESMRTETRPTRAEVSDAAFAVDSGVDAIMLAGETAIGQHPVRAVQVLDAIIRDAEAMPPANPGQPDSSHLLGGHGRAICEAAVTLANRGEATAIVAVTRGGKTARLLSALRPRAPVFAATDNPVMARRLKLAWGVIPVLCPDFHGDVSEEANRIGRALVDEGAIPRGSVIVLVSITPELARGPSNFLKLQRV
jgi:pyruvate kinase